MGKEIERLVTVPIQRQDLPPRPDVTTSTDSESQLQNECQTVEATAGSSPQEMQEGKHLKRKANSEERADSSPHQQQKKTKPSDAKDEAKTNPATLSKLPVELQRLIFDEIFLIEDIACFGLASQQLWAIARDYIDTYYASFLGSWAGQRIVFVGDDVETGDYPPGLFSEEELDELPETVDIPYNYEVPDITWEEDVPMTLHHFTLPLFARKEKFLNLSELSTDIYTACRDRNKFRYDPALKSTYRDILTEEATYYPQDRPWILRNLITKEFVRSEAIALKPEFIHGPFIDGFGFGQVIISRICWSTDPCTSINCELPIHRGVWAGHAFDVTTLATHRAETMETEWRDVSEEVANEIAIICASKYGPNWHKIICGRFYDGRDAS
ncbi:hypothetical protein THARTR1_08235 [Trichoderma harzianum]|uniref:F-box domain-containing protein n=1 Tax=Trichoderma harzianum TaxID=5544 RepID=A0A2K0U059_TRIHA|nr:hypothetical protein THARTR1_08235 [Trichoderma harzianum]